MRAHIPATAVILCTAIIGLNGCKPDVSPKNNGAGAPISAPKMAETGVQNNAQQPVQPDDARSGFDGKFRCGEKVVRIRLSGDGETGDMSIANVSYAMKRAISASGARYNNLGDDSTVFWSKGDKAYVTVDGEELPECTLMPEEKPVQPAAGQIDGVDWMLEEIEGQPINEGQRQASIRFDEQDSTVSGSNGCNRYNTRYSRPENAKLHIAPQIATTMMACPEEMMALERQFMNILPQINAYGFEGNGEAPVLILIADDKPVMKFRVK